MDDLTTLTLSRKPGQSIDIGRGLLKIKIRKIHGDIVIISITAPKPLKILRNELLEKATAINRAIAAGIPIHIIRDELDYQENQT